MSQPTKGRPDAGFTLVETLVAVIIEAMIVAALGSAFIGILKTTTQVKTSLLESGDARIAAAYIVSDAANSSGPEISLTDTTSCPDASPPAAGTATPVVRFDFSETSSAGVTTPDIVIYYLASGSLIRRECQNGALTSDSIVARTVATAAAACSPVADCTGAPTSITVTVTETPAADGFIYQYKLTGVFQKLVGDGAPVSSTPSPVILLGAGTTCSGTTSTIDVEGGATMRVYGNTYINSKDGAACKAMTLGNGGAFHAGGTNILTGGSCNGSGCPTTAPYSPAITDPYASLAAPPTTGLTSRTGCSGPGLYASGINITSGTCTLTTGVYVVQNGFSVSNNASVNTGAGGVLIYLMSGQFSIGSALSVTLTAMTTGTWKGLALWQVAADTQQIVIGNGAQTVVFNGAIYGPKAQLAIDGGVLPSVTAIVVQTVSLSNGITITIGSPSATPLSITAPASLPGWTVNRPAYSATVSATGGDGNFDWSATGLPAGLTMNASSGIISGTPTAAGTASVTVTLNDDLGDTADTQAYSLVIGAAPSIATTSPLPGGELTGAYSLTMTASAGTAPFTWTATGVPAGLSLSGAGVLSGTPTATGTSTIALALTDNAGATASASLSITVVAAPSITTASPLPAGEITAPYSTTLAASGGATPYAWSIASGTMPAGLTLSAAGVVSGTPTAAGTTAVTYKVSDAAGGTATKSLSITIGAAPTITSVSLLNKSGGTAGKMQLGDSVVVVYSAQMKVGSFCSAWSGDTTNQTINAASNVTISVSHPASGNGVLTVASTSCAFNFGSIDLGSNSYVTGATTFGGTSTNVSTIAWTASTHTLTIIFGGVLTGAVATTAVGSTSPKYTASPTIADSSGGFLSNSPFSVTPAAVRF